MLTPKYIEEGRALEKAARRVINYRKDIARPEDLQRLREKVDALQKALKKRSIEEVRAAENELLAIVGKVQPPRRIPGDQGECGVICRGDRPGSRHPRFLFAAFQDPDRVDAADPEWGHRAPHHRTAAQFYRPRVPISDFGPHLRGCGVPGTDGYDRFNLPGKDKAILGWLGNPNVFGQDLPGRNRPEILGVSNERETGSELLRGEIPSCEVMRTSVDPSRNANKRYRLSGLGAYLVVRGSQGKCRRALAAVGPAGEARGCLAGRRCGKTIAPTVVKSCRQSVGEQAAAGPCLPERVRSL